MNKSLKEIHDLLVAQVNSLSDAIDETSDIAVAKQLLVEMQEVVHRVNVTQNLLFTKASAEIDACLPQIRSADSTLKQSIASIQNVAKALNQVTELLTYVDQAIDLAKGFAL
ncbi:MAG TPA: hypothetical protein VJ252_03550 [Chthoniobacterales bacterium]|jgi:hypothetical protein|nr:hypothetical protein [Chthoniobacterales bacterium]